MSPVRETLATKFWHLIAVICVVAIVPGDTLAEMPSFHAQSPSTSVQAKSPPAEVPPDQLDSFVAPIALYPDPLLAQTLAASTYPLEIIQLHGKWSFDAKAGEQELLYRRVGANELDAIQISHGFFEAQHAYALRSHKLYNVNQYAQRIISTPGQEDGLTWQSSDGKWEGPIGEKIARTIAQGYSPGEVPYYGYYFKALKGQGAAAPLGKLDYVIEGVMIGGFALVASPAQ